MHLVKIWKWLENVGHKEYLTFSTSDTFKWQKLMQYPVFRSCTTKKFFLSFSNWKRKKIILSNLQIFRLGPIHRRALIFTARLFVKKNLSILLFRFFFFFCLDFFLMKQYCEKLFVVLFDDMKICLQNMSI